MYSRYIPPAKENAPPSRAQATPAAASTPSSTPYARYTPGQVPAPAPAPVQPPPAQPQRIVFNDDDFAPVDYSQNKRSIDDELTGAAEDKKSKKSRSKKSRDETPVEDIEEPGSKDSKSRKRKRADANQDAALSKDVPGEKDATSEPAPEASPVEPVAEPQVEPPTPTPPPAEEERKPKREKKKKRKQDDNEDIEMPDADADADDMRKRHKSVFEKVQKALQAKDAAAENASEEDEPEPEVEHGLEPLPQPEPVVFDASKLTYETLPPWLASPIRVGPDISRPFTELGISSESARVLESKGFKDAFAVQTAVLPLLLPSPDRQGDVVVAAPTGSGKTLSYVLPMVQDISKGRVTRLRALIVLPTRDLVQQVQQACEACAAAFSVSGGKKVKVGTAMGNRVFREEQSAVMGEEQRYYPRGYEQYLQKQSGFADPEESDDEAEDLDLQRTQPLPYHVVEHTSKVDVLICTPGRLVEHITKTPGFSLDYVRWLIVDEADKLLAQDFQQWLDTVTDKLNTGKPGARDFPGSNKSGVRKVILSATMTRDISLLNGLKLARPKLIVVEGTKAGEQSLPPLLKEFAIKVREPSLKPLFLLDLLNSKHMSAVGEDDTGKASAGSETSSDSESSSSESDSDADSDSYSSSDSSDDEGLPQPKHQHVPTTSTSKPSLTTTVLIFTKSNEAALRLSRLLALLSPTLGPLIGTLTSSTKTSRRARTLRAFAQGKTRILVASDLVSRGIDLPDLGHVVNYDVPLSETSYVHRVGRTARAGRGGCAWTLVEHAEARRFWREFAGEGKGKESGIVRAGKVERVRIGEGEMEEERVRAYEEALGRLAREAGGR
ncbi:P-loop containing nucleoside triphosphate hydrolase protein [Staphylotrichum tortipilum]|uniref:ATP-dependent RNA helicase n=1 Tax=Staphylotrichum tortipilum TaxID=2831512 RepID=A0AAN6MG98_9PEZI|nr:P-loop containing nucleoside triphosphate hydrolase protein [Staphylotrichum longicolle]